MAPRKTERILNLTICLLVSGRYLPKSRIREAVEGYHDLSDAAFERTFERDKDELRSLGVPIEVGNYDPLFDDEPGYRILSSEFELPAIELDAEEASVVGVAARVWQHASMAASTMSAIAKLRAAGVEPDTSQLASLEPSVQATEPAFEPLWNAVLERTRMSFTYRDGQHPDPGAVGNDGLQGPLVRDRPGRRPEGHPDVQAVPDHRSAASGSPSTARTRCRPISTCGRSPAPWRPGSRRPRPCSPSGPDARPRCAGAVSRRPPTLPLPSGFDVIGVSFTDLYAAAEEITQHAADVLVLEPIELRELVLKGLKAVADSAAAA